MEHMRHLRDMRDLRNGVESTFTYAHNMLFLKGKYAATMFTKGKYRSMWFLKWIQYDNLIL